MRLLLNWCGLCILILALAGCGNKKTNDIWLIPENYEGYVYAFYNIKDAPELTQENGYDVHIINEEGYFATSKKDMDYGVVTDKYYYVNETGHRTPINEDCVRNMGTGGHDGPYGSVQLHYTGIEIRTSGCGKEFVNSTNGMDTDDANNIIMKVKSKYYTK